MNEFFPNEIVTKRPLAKSKSLFEIGGDPIIDFKFATSSSLFVCHRWEVSGMA